MANLANEMTRLKKIVSEESNHKRAKEQECQQYVKDAREDLQKICRVLLKKKLENEDLIAEVSLKICQTFRFSILVYNEDCCI